MDDLGRLAWEHPLLADLGLLSQESPHCLILDRLALERPLVAGHFEWFGPWLIWSMIFGCLKALPGSMRSGA